MPATAAFALLVCVSGLGPTQSIQQAGSSLPVVLYDYARVPPGSLRQAQDEMARIYREIGVSVVWLDANALSAPENEATLRRVVSVVIRRNSGVPASVLPNGTVGTASGTADDRGRVAYVFYERAEQFSPLYRGRFLGHFIAHEVGHMLLPLYSHTPTGLMRAEWNRADLELAQNGRLRFTSEQADQIRARVAELTRGIQSAR